MVGILWVFAAIGAILLLLNLQYVRKERKALKSKADDILYWGLMLFKWPLKWNEEKGCFAIEGNLIAFDTRLSEQTPPSEGLFDPLPPEPPKITSRRRVIALLYPPDCSDEIQVYDLRFLFSDPEFRRWVTLRFEVLAIREKPLELIGVYLKLPCWGWLCLGRFEDLKTDVLE